MAKAKAPEEVRFTLRIPAKLHADIGELAEADHRSVTSWIIVALEAAVAAAKEREAKR